MTNEIVVNSAKEGYPFDGWAEVQGGGTTGVAAAAAAFGERLYVFAKGVNDDRIYVNSAKEGYPFDGWAEVQGGGTTDAAPAAAAFGERLYVFTKKPDPSFWEADWSPIEWPPFGVSRQTDGIHFKGKLTHDAGNLIDRKFGAVWRLELHADRIPPSPTGRYASNPNVQLSGRLLGE
jgi:hypothetical protein